jgi:predicted DNA-binding protein
MKQRKTLKARISINMKRGFNNLADQCGESEGVIVREAPSEFLNKSTVLLIGGENGSTNLAARYNAE